VSPFTYTGLVWALLVGIVVWGDWPDAWLLAGAAIIVGVGIYMTRLSPR
jgi:drug/metabolite transporter (DMT)-like permease